jgi:hypothetical protein
MNGKAGTVCSREYRKGAGCPLIIRSTSEDVLVGSAFGILQHMRPSLWLRPMLNTAFDTRIFNTVPMKNLVVEFWGNVNTNSHWRSCPTPPCDPENPKWWLSLTSRIRESSSSYYLASAKYSAASSSERSHPLLRTLRLLAAS